MTEMRARKVEKGDTFRLYSGYLKHISLLNMRSLKLGSVLRISEELYGGYTLEMLIRKVEYKNKWYHKIAKLIGIKLIDYIEVESLSE